MLKKYNLQLFAEEEQNDTADSKNEKKYTDADVDAIIKKRLGRERNKYEKLLEEQKSAPEDDEKEKQLNEREKALYIREKKADAKELLTEKGYPVSFSKLLNYTDDKSFEDSVKALEDALSEYRDVLEIKRSTGRTPESGRGRGKVDPLKNAFARPR